MTATEFRQTHGDPTTWTTTDIESFEVLRLNDDHLANHTLPGGTPNQGKSNAAKASADRLRWLLAPAA